MADALLTDSALAALQRVEFDLAFHDMKLRRIQKQQQAYEGLLQPLSEAAQWESQLAPPILNHAIEVAMTMLVDPDVSFEITPQPKFYSADDWKAALDGARAHERLFRRQMIQDRFREFGRPFVLQAAINRVSIAKTYWREQTVPTKELQWKPVKGTGWLGKLAPQKMKTVDVTKTVFDGPVTETVDLRDFYWQESAVSLEKSRYCAHAVWMTPGDIVAMAQKSGWSEEAAREIQKLGVGDTELPQGNEIELQREQRSRKKGLIEVLEIWDRETMQIYVIGRRRFLLDQRDWPFWHKQYPFVSMSLAPFPFSIQGLSLVEKLAPMQEMYWNLLNQTADNVKLINNAIIVMASDFDDPDSFEWAPGAVNTVDRPDQVAMLKPEINIAEAATPLMQQLSSDIGNMAMGQPLTIPLSGRVTATEIATLSQIAQNAASHMKANVINAYARIGWQRMKLNQQFIQTPQYIHDLGLDSQAVVDEIMPQLLAGDYDFVIKPDTESNVRQERRSEATQLANLAGQLAPVLAQTGQPLNLRKFVERVLEAFDVDPEGFDEYFAAAPQPGLEQQPSQPNPNQQPEGAGPGGQPVGTTTAPSPATAAGLGAGAMVAKALAAQGGAQNVPR